MERKVGDVFEYETVILKVVPRYSCLGCYFADKSLCKRPKDIGSCSSLVRDDNVNVKFIKL